VAVARVAEVQRHGRQVLAVTDAFERALQAQLVPVGVQAAAGGGAKRPAQMVDGDADLTRDLRKLQWLSELLGEQRLDRLHRGPFPPCDRRSDHGAFVSVGGPENVGQQPNGRLLDAELVVCRRISVQAIEQQTLGEIGAGRAWRGGQPERVLGALVDRGIEVADDVSHDIVREREPLALVAGLRDGASLVDLSPVVERDEIGVGQERGPSLVAKPHRAPWEDEDVVLDRARVPEPGMPLRAAESADGDGGAAVDDPVQRRHLVGIERRLQGHAKASYEAPPPLVAGDRAARSDSDRKPTSPLIRPAARPPAGTTIPQ
jgi:hypothetical protein